MGRVLGQVPCVERGSVRGLAEPAAGLLLSTRHPPGAARAPPRHTEGQRRTACSLRPAARRPADRGHGVGDDGRGSPKPVTYHGLPTATALLEASRTRGPKGVRAGGGASLPPGPARRARPAHCPADGAGASQGRPLPPPEGPASPPQVLRNHWNVSGSEGTVTSTRQTENVLRRFSASAATSQNARLTDSQFSAGPARRCSPLGRAPWARAARSGHAGEGARLLRFVNRVVEMFSSSHFRAESEAQPQALC